MGVEQLALSTVAAIGNRPRLAATMFRFTAWGNPFAEERFTYPYPMYERMRSAGPVVYNRTYRQWFVFGYDEVHDVLRSPDTATSPIGDLLLSTRRYKRLSPSARLNFSRWLVTNDPPDHTRLRASVSRAFTPRQIADYEPLLANVVDELLSALPTSGEIDVVRTFTNQLPIQAIAELLGLPSDDRAWLVDASRELGGMLDPMNPFDPVSMSARFAELDDYFTSIVDYRRSDPGNDLVSALAADHGEGPVLDRDEIVAMIAFLLFAGHETVTGMLGNALVALARFTDQRELLRHRPDLIGNAVEELLRFDSSAQVTARQATADLTIGDVTIRKGDNIALMLGAANRDKRRWADADELRLDRPDPKPITFGFGAHHCLGAALARMQLQLALPPLLDRLGDYTVDLHRATWNRSFTLRGPRSLPVTIALAGVPR